MDAEGLGANCQLGFAAANRTGSSGDSSVAEEGAGCSPLPVAGRLREGRGGDRPRSGEEGRDDSLADYGKPGADRAQIVVLFPGASGNISIG